jgi:hypothetical protein
MIEAAKLNGVYVKHLNNNQTAAKKIPSQVAQVACNILAVAGDSDLSFRKS